MTDDRANAIERQKRRIGSMFVAPRRCESCKELRPRDQGRYVETGNNRRQWRCDRCGGGA